MAWSNTNSGSHIPERVKRIVRRNANNRCQIGYPDICLTTGTEYDHKVNLKTLGLDRNDPAANDPRLLQLVCRPCHIRKTAQEAAEGRRRRRYRKPDPHPGKVTVKENPHG